MLKTTDILKKIKEVGNEELALKVKNTKTGDILNVEYNYVADEVLFLFASKSGTGTVKNYLSQLQYESQDDCWDSYIDNEDDSLSPEEFLKRKYDLITEFNSRVYVGDTNECPIRNFHQTFEMTGMEVTPNEFILLY